MKTLQESTGRLDPNDAPAIVKAAMERYGDELAIAMSFQIGGVVLLDMIHRMGGAPLDVVSIDTGRLPEETYECARTISRKYGVQIRWVFPRHDDVESMIREKGVYSFKDSVENRKECCRIRKVEPLSRALEPYQAWMTGRRADQSHGRRDLQIVEPDPVHPGMVKVNPLLNWSMADLWCYVRDNDVPYNRLYDEGYRSIGCECCTRPCKGDEDERAGRWWWEHPDHKECGLHLSFKDGSGI